MFSQSFASTISPSLSSPMILRTDIRVFVVYSRHVTCSKSPFSSRSVSLLHHFILDTIYVRSGRISEVNIGPANYRVSRR